jgi:hypothetical protein
MHIQSVRPSYVVPSTIKTFHPSPTTNQHVFIAGILDNSVNNIVELGLVFCKGLTLTNCGFISLILVLLLDSFVDSVQWLLRS